MKTFKNWWLEILGFLIVVLDQGFDIFEPVLAQIGASEKTAATVRIVFALYGFFILYKKRLPTQNPAKLQRLVDEKLANGDPVPRSGPKG